MIRRLRFIWRSIRHQTNQPATALWRAIEAEEVVRLFRPRGHILDLGCGDGRFLALASLASRGHWTGVDLDQQEVTLARNSGLYERVHRSPAHAIPERSASFDAVFSNSALEHMSNLDGVLREVNRLLRKNGIFVLTVPLDELPRKLLVGRILDACGFRKSARRYRQAILRRLAHRNNFSCAEWRRLLVRRGFRIDVSRPYLSSVATTTWEVLANLTGGIAVLLTGGRTSPRQIQRSLGLSSLNSPLVATVVFALMAPFWLPLLIERRPRHGGAVLIKATKVARTG